MTTETVQCRTPAVGKHPTNIARWKFDCVRSAILAVLGEFKSGLPFRDLTEAAGQRIAPYERARLGSLMWYVTTVKLELEVRAEIQRFNHDGRQWLRIAC